MDHSKMYLSSRELTCPLFEGAFEDDFPFPQVGYGSFVEGTIPETNSNPLPRRMIQKVWRTGEFSRVCIPPKTNIAPENQCWEEVIP